MSNEIGIAVCGLQLEIPVVGCEPCVDNIGNVDAAVSEDQGARRLLATVAGDPDPFNPVPGATGITSSNNDIAVSTKSAQAVPGQRAPAAQTAEVACDHLTFFSSNVGRQAVLEGRKLS